MQNLAEYYKYSYLMFIGTDVESYWLLNLIDANKAYIFILS